MKTRISPPPGYTRIDVKEGSFEAYLRDLPLRPHGYKVRYYDGREKRDTRVYCAVVDMEIGKRDLATMCGCCLVFGQNICTSRRHTSGSFQFHEWISGDYTKWAEGYRISVKGNQVSWYKAKEEDYSYKTFRAYLDVVFAYAGTLSLLKN